LQRKKKRKKRGISRARFSISSVLQYQVHLLGHLQEEWREGGRGGKKLKGIKREKKRESVFRSLGFYFLHALGREKKEKEKKKIKKKKEEREGSPSKSYCPLPLTRQKKKMGREGPGEKRKKWGGKKKGRMPTGVLMVVYADSWRW